MENQELESKIKESRKIIKAALRLYTPEQLAIATSGGKDSIVLEHLLRNCPLSKLKVVFTKKNATTVSKQSFQIDAPTMQEALHAFNYLRPTCQAIFIGQRASDRCGDLPPFEPTTKGWPAFMRINPLAKWSYREIWQYIDNHALAYPKEYSEGYTSIGPNAEPNPLLRNADGSYKHARELENQSAERDGRK